MIHNTRNAIQLSYALKTYTHWSSKNKIPDPALSDLIRKRKTALFVVDMQVLFCSGQPEASIVFPEESKEIGGMIPKLRNLIGAARETKLPIIWIRWPTGGYNSKSFDYYEIRPGVGEREITKPNIGAALDNLSPMP